jgi:hypothetical protein
MGEERELYEIRHQLECIFDVLHRLAAAAERLIPEGNEQERIALQSFLHCGGNPQEGFRSADWFLEERNRQRAKQAE